MATLIDQEDIFLWSDGTWCFRFEVGDGSYKSDDYEVLPLDSARWISVVTSNV